MDQKKLIAVVSAVVGVMIIAAIFLSRGNGTDDPSGSEDVASGQQNRVSGSQENIIISEKADFDITEAPAEVATKEEIREQNISVYGEKLSFEDLSLLDPDTLDRLLEEYGDYASIYALMNLEQRQELIDVLNLKDQLREQLGPLIAIEENSDMRAFMLVRVLPDMTIGDNDSDLFNTVDRDLLAILDRPTNTTIEGPEWIARMHLSNITDQGYALDWVRDASVAHPDNQEVNFVASSLTLKIGASIEGVTDRERAEAENYLKDTLLGDTSEQISPDDRTAAYYNLYWGENKEETLNFYREKLASETDPNAIRTLQGLIDRIESRL